MKNLRFTILLDRLYNEIFKTERLKWKTQFVSSAKTAIFSIIDFIIFYIK